MSGETRREEAPGVARGRGSQGVSEEQEYELGEPRRGAAPPGRQERRERG